MQRHKSLLVAVDGSESSLHALEESVRLAKWSHARVTVVTVAPSYDGDLSLVGVKDIGSLVFEPCLETLGKILDAADSAGISIKPVCEVGEPVERIISVANAEECDLIVMGRGRPRSILGRVFWKSPTLGVIESGGRDVLVVPAGSPLSWNRILLLLNGRSGNEKVLGRGAALAGSYGAELQILVDSSLFPSFPHSLASELGSERRKELSASMGSDLKYECISLRGDTLRAISDLAGKEEPEMIVLGHRGSSGQGFFLTASLVERIIDSFSFPLYVVAT